MNWVGAVGGSWDPVENASLMPWLVATALVHSLVVTENQKLFNGFSILLAIIAFSLSLLGTFLVRSGVLISVHSFASDPERGMFILALIGVLTGGALILYALRVKKGKKDRWKFSLGNHYYCLIMFFYVPLLP